MSDSLVSTSGQSWTDERKIYRFLSADGMCIPTVRKQQQQQRQKFYVLSARVLRLLCDRVCDFRNSVLDSISLE